MINAYYKKQEKSQINNLNFHLKHLEKEEQKKPKVSKRKEIIKIRSEIPEKKMKTEIQCAKIYGMQQKQLKREVHSITGLPQETNKQTKNLKPLLLP